MPTELTDNPFVGLRPFESHESLLFFGRQEQTMQLLQRLHRHRFVAVIGNSGSGKSSLVRAGLIPRLQAGYLVNDSDKWLITSMRPGHAPLCNLSRAICIQSGPLPGAPDATVLEKKIKEQGAGILQEMLFPLTRCNTNIFLLVDQFEELFRFSLNGKGAGRRDEAVYFVNTLLELCSQTDIPVYVVITMRSDFIGDCAGFYGLPEAMNESQYIVPRLNRVQLRNIIEGPVRLYNERISPSLTARLLNDVQSVNDELPLLQHTLMRIWEKEIAEEQKPGLDLAGYEQVGGIEKALSNHADEALQGVSGEELQIAKKLFQALTTIDENGRKIRRPVRLSELVLLTGIRLGELQKFLFRFIEAKRSFLCLSSMEGSDDMLVDISHESLIRQWKVLSEWVDEEAGAAGLFLRLVESAKLYAEKKKDFLSGNELHPLLEWYHRFRPTATWARRYSPDYEYSIRYLQQSEQEWKAAVREKERQRRKKLRNLRILFAAAMIAVVAISLLLYSVYKKDISINNQLARNYWQNSREAREKGDLSRAVLLVAEAVSASKDKGLARNLLIDVQSFLPLASLNNVFPHAKPVYAVAFSKGGKMVLTAGYDGSARLWDVASGKQIGPAMVHRGGIRTALFSPDEKKILTAGDDSTARLWNAATCRQIGPSLKHEGAVHSAAFSADGRWIVTAGADSVARLWDAVTLKQSGPFMKHNGWVSGAVLNHDGSKILTAGSDSTACLWNAVTPQLIGKVRHAGAVNSALFSPDEKKILTASDDSTARLWNATTLKPAAGPMKHDGWVVSAVFDGTGTSILTAGRDSTARLWEAATGKQIGPSMKMDDRLNAAVFSPDNATILTAGYDHTARLWDAATRQPAGSPLFHADIVYKAVFNPQGTGVLTAGADGTARLWSIARPVKKQQVVAVNEVPVSAVLSNDGKQVLVACLDNTARVFDALTGRPAGPPMQHDSAVMSACFSPDGRKILTAGYDSTVRLWDAATHKQIIRIKQRAEVKQAVFSPDGKRVLSASGAEAREWDAATGKLTSIFLYNDAALNSAVYNAGGNRVLTANSGGIACLFDRATTRILRTYGQAGYVIKWAGFSRDDQRIVTAGEEELTRQWDIATGKQAGTSIKHGGMVNMALFENKGSTILTACVDGTARLWDTLSGYPVGSPMKHSRSIQSAVFSTDGRKIVTASLDKTVRIWDIEGDADLPPELFKLQVQAITGAELDVRTNEIHFIPLAEWQKLKTVYEAEARKHYSVCGFHAFNLWALFHPQEAMKIHSGAVMQ